jgi:uncharacterized membrane protein YsdA (DUF1294 family)
MLPFILSILLGALLWWLVKLSPLFAWLIAVNLITLLTYGYDKYQAGRGGWRISERALLMLALIGGSLGALLGMQVFHHKTAKSSFKLRIAIVLIIQAVLVAGYLWWRGSMG